MLRPFFHAWERRLAAATKTRVVRPFNWGLDWLPPDAPQDGPPFERLQRWVQHVLQDTPTFFAAPVTTDYVFEAAAPDVQRQGEAGTLRFPSVLVTPHPVNNTVTARWFPAARDRENTRPRGRAVVVLPQWNAGPNGHIGLSRLMARSGISALRLSLPYHDVRMPEELARADYIVSADVTRTLQVCRQAVLDARRAIAWLASQGFDRIGIVGSSLGSCLSLLTSAHEPRIKAQALNHVSPYFADVVWLGLSTEHVRRGLDGHITIEQLRELWMPISPMTHLERLRNTQTLLVYARYDLTFPVDLSKRLVAEFRRLNLPHGVVRLPCGHYTTGTAPFKYLDAYLLIRFLRRAL